MIKKTLNQIFDFFVGAAIFVVPLIIFSVDEITPDLRFRIFVIFAAVCLALFCLKESGEGNFGIAKSKVNWLLLLLAIFLLGKTIFSYPDFADGAVWIFLLLFCLLLGVFFRRKSHLQWGLFLYILASDFLALFAIIWFLLKQTLIFPADSGPASALWFALNLLLVIAVIIWGEARSKYFWYASFALPLLVLALFNFRPAWIFLLAAAAVISFFIFFTKKTKSLSLWLVIAIAVALSLVFLLPPADKFRSVFGPGLPAAATVPDALAWKKFWQGGDASRWLFGAGFRQSGASFWEAGELVNWPAVNNFPPFANVYLDILWFGGAVFLLLLFLLFAFIGQQRLARYSLLLPKSGLHLISVLALLFFLALMFFSPFNFILLFSASIFLGAVLALGQKERQFYLPAPLKKIFPPAGFIFLALAATLIFFSWRGAQAALLYGRAVQKIDNGLDIDLAALAKAIALSPQADRYRLIRLKLFLSAEAIPFAGFSSLAKAEADYFGRAELAGPEHWRLGILASRLADKLADLEEKKYWLGQANSFYRRALIALPRNIVLKTEVSRFWREQAELIISSGEVPASYYKKAQDLLDDALAIDKSYPWTYLEKAELLLLAGDSDRALETLRPFAGQDSYLALRSGQIAFARQKFKEAESFYLLAQEAGRSSLSPAGPAAVIWSVNYELARAYLADNKKALAQKQLLELERQPATAEQNALLESLRSLLK